MLLPHNNICDNAFSRRLSLERPQIKSNSRISFFSIYIITIKSGDPKL